MARLQGIQPRERLFELVAGDLVFLHIQRVEDRLVEHATLLFVTPQVQRLRVFQQRERRFDQPRRVGQVVTGPAEPLGQVLAPLLDVPQPGLDLALWQAADAAERRRVVSRRWKGVVSDCETALNSVTYSHLLDERNFALDCVRALREGHTNAAQALAANLLDSVLRKYFDEESRKKVTSNNFKRDGVKFDLDDHLFRISLTFAPVWCAHVKYRQEHGDPIPSTYGRHPSAHAVSRTQYKRVNAVRALMVVTSVVKFFDVELARRDAKADK